MKFSVIKFFVFCFFTLLYSTNSFPQRSNKTDSLERELIKAVDTSKVNILNSLSKEYRKSDPQKSIDYLNRALKLSEKIDFPQGESAVYNTMGSVYCDMAEYEKASAFHQKSLSIRKSIGDKIGMATSLNNIGDVNIFEGNYETAQEYYLKALRICDEIGHKELMQFNNIAASYYYMGNYEKALEYYFIALKTEDAKGNKKRMINPTMGIGNVYYNMEKYENSLFYYKQVLTLSTELKNQIGISNSLIAIGNVYERLNKNDTALKYHLQSIKIKEELSDKPGIALSMMNIGNIYSQTKKFPQALEYYEKAFALNKELDDKNGIAKTLCNIGILYSEQGNTEKSATYLKKCIAIADSIHSNDLIMLGNEALSEVYFKKGDYKNAYGCYRNYTAIKDSILNETTTKNMAEINTKYETEKKEKEISNLTKDKLIKEQELKNQQTLRNGLIIGVFLLLILAGLTYSRYLVKQKANKEIAEKNREITESISYAKRIQTSFLTSEKYISQRLSDYFIFYNPRNIVSGDFYWLMDTASISTPTQQEAASTSERFLYICTADCTGHGIPGAFMSLISMGILNEIIYSKTHLKHTDEILNELRRIIILAVNPEGAEEEGKDGMDAVLCRFDFDKMELEYSAANNSFFIIRDGQLLIFKPDKMPVGKYLGTEKPFTRHTIPIKKGDCIYTFSDGFADQFGGPENKKFQSKRLKELLLNHCHKPMRIQKEIFTKTIKDWQGTTEQIDDMLLIGIRI